MGKMGKTIISIIVLLTIAILTIGVTYSYLSASVTTNASNLSVSGKLNVIYIANGTITGGLNPTTSYENGISTTAHIKLGTDSVNAVADLYLTLVNLPSELAISGLKWEVYKDGSGTAYSQGTFSGLTEDSVITIVNGYQLSTIDTVFTIYIWLNGEEAGNETMNKSFEAILSASAYVGNAKEYIAGT